MCADCSLSGRKHLFAVSEFETLENLKFIFRLCPITWVIGVLPAYADVY